MGRQVRDCVAPLWGWASRLGLPEPCHAERACHRQILLSRARAKSLCSVNRHAVKSSTTAATALTAGGGDVMANQKRKGLQLLIIAALLLGACARARASGTPLPTAAASAALTTPAAPVRSKDSSTLTYDTSSGDPETLDTAFDYEVMGGMIIQNTYDTLIFYNKDKADKFVPQLATGVPSQANGGISADGRTYTFKIRAGVKFHNGDTLTPDDVAFTFRRGLLQGGLSSPQWLLFQPILGVAASPSGNNDITDLVDSSGKLGDDKASLLKADPAKLLAACQAVTSAITADDAANTVTFHLAQSWGPFLAALANAWGSIMDEKWVGASGGWDGDCHTWQKFYQTKSADINQLRIGTGENGTGPYVLDHWTPNQEIALKAFDAYWRTEPAWPGGPTGVPRLKTINLKTNVSQFATRLAALRAGEADMIDPQLSSDWTSMDPLTGETCGPTGACAPAADPSQPLRAFRGLPQTNRTDVFFNFNADTSGGNDFIGSGKLDGQGIPPDFFSDLHVRKAFNYCFDWDAYIKGVLLGDGVQSYDVMLPGEIGYSDQDPHYTYDPARCQAEFQASSLKGADGRSLWDTGFRMSIAYNVGTITRQVADEILARDIRAVNAKFDVTVLGLPVKTFFAAVNAHKLPLLVLGWQEDIHDPNDWVVPFVTGVNGARQSLPTDLVSQLNALIDQGAQETDPAKRTAIYKQFNQAFYEAAPDILLAVQTGRFYEQRWVLGYYYNPIYSTLYYYALSKQ